MAQQPRVRDLLEEAILEGELKPGERLRAEALAQRFGTSRTPIREALLQLEGQGLVEVEPNRGAVVRAFDRDDLLDLYEVRALLEPAAAALAATRATDAADGRAATARATSPTTRRSSSRSTATSSFTGSSPRRRVARGWRSRCAPHPASRGHSVTGSGNRTTQRAESLVCHRRIVAAFRARDPQMAEAAMRMHILGAVAFLEETWPNH